MFDASTHPGPAARARRRHCPRHRRGRARVDPTSAIRAYKRWMHPVAALAMDQFDWRTAFRRHPPIAPAEHRNQDRIEIETLAGKPVLDVIAGRHLLDTFEDSVTDQRSEPRAQDIARNSDLRLEFVETAPAKKRLAQDKHRPSLAYHRKRPRNRAIRLADRFPAHPILSGLALPSLLKTNFTQPARCVLL